MSNKTGPKSIVAPPDDAELPMSASARRTGYSSPSIKARRHRILDEARRMIGEVGIASLSMDEVARRAEVAKRTLYNAFQSKERLVAAAIHQYFEDYASRITYSTQEQTLDRVLERLIVVARRNLDIRNYTRALMNIYHAHDVDPDIRDAIYCIASESHEPWIRQLQAKRQLQTWVDADELISSLVTFRYGLAYAWAEGLIEDDAFLLNLLRGFLTFMAGATRGAARKEIEQVLSDVAHHPLLHPGQKA
jgi:TetR/AcrR family transcriptional regulator, cholesterol catabolism regulator